MQVLICPHCKAKIKFAGENLPRKVTCPGCKEPFAPGESNQQAGAGSRQSASKPGDSKRTAKEIEEDFDVVDDDESEAQTGSEKSKNRRDDARAEAKKKKENRSDDDDERPKSRRNRDEDRDEERSERRRRRDEDDDEERSGHDRDDDRRGDDDFSDREPTREQFKKTLLGLKLINFALWAQVAAFGGLLLLALGSTLKMGFVADIRFIVALGGIPGWLLGVAGGVFLLLGFKRGKLQILLIALVAAAGLHLIIDLYLAFASDGRSGPGMLVARGAKGNIYWEITATLFFYCQAVLIVGLFPVFLFFGTIFELARFVLLMLVLREYAGMCREKKMAKRTIVFAAILVGTFGVSFGLFAAMLSSKPDKSTAGAAAIVLFLAFASYTTVYVLSALFSGKLKRRVEKLAGGEERSVEDDDPPKRREKKKRRDD